MNSSSPWPDSLTPEAICETISGMIASMIGASVPPSVSWIIGFFNGAVILSFVFSRSYRVLPERARFQKAGCLAWWRGPSWDRYSFR